MNDQQKKEIAKKNLAGFMMRLSELPDEKETKRFIVCYVHRKDGSVTEDFYWTDHEISPTAIRLWLAKNYNSYSTNRSRWATRVSFKTTEYEKIKTMISGEEPVIIEDVEIVPIE